MNVCVKDDVYHLVTSVGTRTECQKDCNVSFKYKGMSDVRHPWSLMPNLTFSQVFEDTCFGLFLFNYCVELFL